MTEFTFSSRTRNALLSENNYEISSHNYAPNVHTSLRASVTVMGTFIYTLTCTSEDVAGSPLPTVLTWKDTILTFRSHDVLQMWLPTAVRRTVNLWSRVLFPVNEEMDGERLLESLEAVTNFLNEHEKGFRVTTCFLLNAFYSFASTNGEEPLLPIPEEPEIPFESLLP